MRSRRKRKEAGSLRRSRQSSGRGPPDAGGVKPATRISCGHVRRARDPRDPRVRCVHHAAPVPRILPVDDVAFSNNRFRFNPFPARPRAPLPPPHDDIALTHVVRSLPTIHRRLRRAREPRARGGRRSLRRASEPGPSRRRRAVRRSRQPDARGRRSVRCAGGVDPGERRRSVRCTGGVDSHGGRRRSVRRLRARVDSRGGRLRSLWFPGAGDSLVWRGRDSVVWRRGAGGGGGRGSLRKPRARGGRFRRGRVWKSGAGWHRQAVGSKEVTGGKLRSTSMY